MNATPPASPDDREIDALLARRYRDTTPEFETRWIDLQRQLRQAPRRRRWISAHGWAAWLAAGTAVAALVVAVFQWQPQPNQPEMSPALAELFAMDATLNSATALLSEETRQALLNLPAAPSTRG